VNYLVNCEIAVTSDQPDSLNTDIEVDVAASSSDKTVDAALLSYIQQNN